MANATERELEDHRRAWRCFVLCVKWFALHVLAIVFFLIFWLVGHAPFVPTLIVVVAAVFIVGSILH